MQENRKIKVGDTVLFSQPTSRGIKTVVARVEAILDGRRFSYSYRLAFDGRNDFPAKREELILCTELTKALF